MDDLDEDYYVDESFETDSQSDAEDLDQKEEEKKEENDDKDEDDNIDDDEDDNIDDDDDEDSATLEDSVDTEDTETDDDPRVEFLLGNPHARRQLLRARLGARSSNRKTPGYPSSSSDEESQVVITKTVAEVNPLALDMDDESLENDDDPDSVRTLKPGSARSQKNVDSNASDEEVDDEEEVDNMKYGDAIDISEEDEGEDKSFLLPSLPAEDVEEQEEDPESDGAYESDAEEDQESPEESDNGASGSDVEVDQLEEDEPESTAAHNDFTVADDSDNNSDRSIRSDITLVDGKHPSQLHLKGKLEAINETEARIETDAKTKPLIEPEHLHKDLTAQQLAAAMPPMDQLEKFLSEMSAADSTLMSDKSTPMKLLDRQMTQMSAMIMKTFRMNGGAANNRSFEELSVATDRLRARSANLEDAQSTTESSLVSARSCESSEKMLWTKGMAPQNYEESVSSVRTRSHCRCPSTTDCTETDQTPVTMLDAAFYVDECGQGDGLMRHPHQRRPPEFQRRLCSATPSSYSTEVCARASNVSHSRSSNEKINYKNLGRKSYSFTNEQMRNIERQNHILLQKMMTVKPTAQIKASTSAMKCNTNTTSMALPPSRLTSAAVNRKKFQRQINLENELIKRKLDAIHTRRPIFK
ncbi:protein hemingway isoform X2 [Drosophila obscura]|uniref:protein hemingway isoform X2 n=1 Tax=Drosophila obscura TaxID=7282 RepID=UPI001BB2031D|nr:protein hemingway isoform X2 [Drosophila obscura]